MEKTYRRKFKRLNSWKGTNKLWEVHQLQYITVVVEPIQGNVGVPDLIYATIAVSQIFL